MALYQSPGLQFQVFVNGVECEILWSRENSLNAILTQLIHHFPFVQQKLAGNSLSEDVKRFLYGLSRQFSDFRVFEKDNNQ